jgi:uncharacterized protein (TIGR02246 family)
MSTRTRSSGGPPGLTADGAGRRVRPQSVVLGRLRRLAAALVVVAPAILPFSPPRAARPAEADENAIRSAIENWRSAFNSRDEQQVCDLFAADIVANYQGEPTRDFASLCEMLRTALRDLGARFQYSVRINEIVVYGDSAVVRLVWTLEIDRAGTPRETVEEPAVDIFRHQADGSWKISRYLAYPAARAQPEQ